MGRAARIGLLRFVATVSAAIIATGILHLFMIPTAWYIAFFLGCGCMLLFCLCLIAPVIIWGLGQPEIDFDWTDEWIDIEDSLSEIAVFAPSPESPEESHCCFIEREIGGTVEFLSQWNAVSLVEDHCIRRDWFNSELENAIVFDSVHQAVKVASTLYLFDHFHRITVRSFNQRILEDAHQ